jgi:hypothetical protein
MKGGTMPKMEAIISVRYRIALETEVPPAEFDDVEGSRAQVMRNERAVEKARRQAAKDAEAIAKDMKKFQHDIIDVLVEEVRDA